jgi:hypothetical protein
MQDNVSNMSRNNRSNAQSTEGFLSIVVVAYEMSRELPRTLHSLSTNYQTGIESSDYEVIVIENSRKAPVSEKLIQSFGSNFTLRIADRLKSSPAYAANYGVSLCRSESIGMFIDGARIASPGLLSTARAALRISNRAVVATLGWHLGKKQQSKSVRWGYNQEVEDKLLESIRWPEDGYRLFDISCFGGSYKGGWFNHISESNAIFMRRSLWDELGGFDERFDIPGGGLVNPDLYRRACEAHDTRLVMLLGEGTFHQVHGGAATGTPERRLRKKLKEWGAQYEGLRGEPFQRPRIPALHFGLVPPQAMRFVRLSLRVKWTVRIRQFKKLTIGYVRKLIRRNTRPS